MINSTQTPQPQVQTQQARPAFAPSYNAVQINLDTPTLNAPQPGYYYDYPTADTQPYYPPVQQMPAQQMPAQQTPAQKTPDVPQPAVEQVPNKDSEPLKDDSVNIEQVLANLSSPDFDKQALQMDEIAQKGLKNEADVEPYVKEEVFNKLMDIMDVDSSKLEGVTERQMQLRDMKAENDLAKNKAEAEGKDPNTIQLPHNLTPEDEAEAERLSPLEQAERNKEYALFTTAILQKTYSDAIEKRTGKVVPLTDLPGAAMVVDELKTNQNPAIRTAAIDSLMYIQRPEYKDDLARVYTIAQSDADDVVSTAAKEALESLNKPEQTAQTVEMTPDSNQAAPSQAA